MADWVNAYTPVMLSTRTCQRGNSCSSCLISFFWWRSEIINSEVKHGDEGENLIHLQVRWREDLHRRILPCSSTSSRPSLHHKHKKERLNICDWQQTLSLRWILLHKRVFYFNFTSSTICSASEKFSTWSPLGSGWTAKPKQSQESLLHSHKHGKIPHIH